MKSISTFFLSTVAIVLSVVIGFQHGAIAGLACATLTGVVLSPLLPQRTHLYAVGPWTLLDLAARSGTNVHALIEGVLTMAPELRVTPTFPRQGLTYETLTCTGLPSGDFAKIGAGVASQKSEWKKEIGSMAKFEAQMRVPEDIIVAAKNQNQMVTEPDILASEAMRYGRGSAIRIGSQFWYGVKISQDGFAGLSTQVDAGNDLTAGAANGTDSCSAYLVYFDDAPVNNEGVHFLLGNGGSMNFSDTWLKQQGADPNDATKLTTFFCNNFLSFMGLVVPRKEAVFRVRNITSANPFTDAVGAQLWQKVPLALRDKSKWRWFMNSLPLYTLQASRATVTVATDGKSGVGIGGVFPDVPESCMGITIVPTDSLLPTERVGLKP